jgi:mono/diheme cytochrome c family protein
VKRFAALLALAVAGLAACGSGSHSAQTPNGKAVFAKAGCGGCHHLAAAGSNGAIGPDLDHFLPTFKMVQAHVTTGGGRMPSFRGKLTTAEIDAVAKFVSSHAGKCSPATC